PAGPIGPLVPLQACEGTRGPIGPAGRTRRDGEETEARGDGDGRAQGSPIETGAGNLGTDETTRGDSSAGRIAARDREARGATGEGAGSCRVQGREGPRRSTRRVCGGSEVSGGGALRRGTRVRRTRETEKSAWRGSESPRTAGKGTPIRGRVPESLPSETGI